MAIVYANFEVQLHGLDTTMLEVDQLRKDLETFLRERMKPVSNVLRPGFESDVSIELTETAGIDHTIR